MCRTAHAVLSTAICGIQMLVRVFMTVILMLENLIRMIMQTLYNFISFMLQLISLIPICCVFLITSRMKCFMCGGGGPCPVNRGGACDCLMSIVAIILLFFIFRTTGVLDKIFYSIGYAKATTHIVRFVPTTGTITECSRNDTDTEYVFYPLDTTAPVLRYFYVDYTTETTTVDEPDDSDVNSSDNKSKDKQDDSNAKGSDNKSKDKQDDSNANGSDNKSKDKQDDSDANGSDNNSKQDPDEWGTRSKDKQDDSKANGRANKSNDKQDDSKSKDDSNNNFRSNIRIEDEGKFKSFDANLSELLTSGNSLDWTTVLYYLA